MGSNIFQLVQMMRKSGSPQQLLMNMLSQQPNSPMNFMLLNLMKKGSPQDIEEFARNIMKEKGLDFDKEFTSFKNTLGL